MKRFFSIALVVSSSVAAGCSGYSENPPLMFTTVNKFGLAASATVPDQGPDVTVGYRSAKLTVVPITYDNGSNTPIVLNSERVEPNSNVKNKDAYSTFSHFQSGLAPGVGSHCIGDTFATGHAAQVVAGKIEQICKQN